MTIRTYNSDNKKILDRLDNKSVKLIFTDPPYNVTKLSWDNWDYNDYLKPFSRIVEGYFACFGPFKLLSEMVIQAEKEKLFEFRFDYIWLKNNFPMTVANQKRPSYQHEMIAVLSNTDKLIFNHVKKEAKHKIQKKNRKTGSEYEKSQGLTRLEGRYISDNKGEKFTSTVLYGNIKATMDKEERTPHPTQKPLSVITHVIEALTNEGDWVIDPFTGSGTTAVACKMLGRNCIAIERDKDYYKIMLDRLEKTEKIKKVSHKNISDLL